MKKAGLLLAAVLMVFAMNNAAKAQSFPESWKEYDLSTYGMPFSIMAPASAKFDWDEDSEELWIDAEDDRYRLMIAIYEESVSELVAEYKEEVEENEDAKLVEYTIDETNGFLAKEDIEGDIDYELYFAFTKSGKTYFVSCNPLAEELYTEDDGRNMYNACKKAAGL